MTHNAAAFLAFMLVSLFALIIGVIRVNQTLIEITRVLRQRQDLMVKMLSTPERAEEVFRELDAITEKSRPS